MALKKNFFVVTQYLAEWCTGVDPEPKYVRTEISLR